MFLDLYVCVCIQTASNDDNGYLSHAIAPDRFLYVLWCGSICVAGSICFLEINFIDL